MLSDGQRRKFFALFNRAWQDWAARHGQDPADADARDTWRRDQLEIAAGVRSIRALGAGLDFNRVMAHFEAVIGDSIYWQQRLSQQAIAYVRHAIGDPGLSADYLLGVARQSLSDPTLSDLSQLSEAVLKRLIRFLAIDKKRRARF